MEQYPRGSRGRFAKPLDRATGARVRIPSAPPERVAYGHATFFIFGNKHIRQYSKNANWPSKLFAISQYLLSRNNIYKKAS